MSYRGLFIFSTLLLICVLPVRLRAEAVSISLLEPSELETVMEAGRDFYVVGKINREGKSAAELPLDIRVEVAVTGLVRAGEKIPIRSVRSRVDTVTGVTPERDIFFEYDGKAPWVNLSRDELRKSPPPDLVYRHENPESFFDPSVKAVVTEDTFAALIQGGCTKDFDTDYEKVYDEDLQWKLYRVFVDAVSGDEVLASRELDVMFGTVQDKVLARPCPPAHLAAVEKFALPRGFRLYRNAMPGYWKYGLPSAYEIPLRSRRNDAWEFLEGRVHAVIYNISENCSQQNVELGHIAFQGWLGTDEIYFYRYDIGEPSVTYEKWGEQVTREGEIMRFVEGETLTLARAEIIRDADAESPYLPCAPAGRAELFPFSAVILRPGETFRLYGAVTPLQPHLSEVVAGDDATFTVLNRADKIRYEFVDALDGVLHREEHAVGLIRRCGSDAAVSIYEFRHTFILPEALRGRVVTVFASAYDAKGVFIEGSRKAFYLYLPGVSENSPQ